MNIAKNRLPKKYTAHALLRLCYRKTIITVILLVSTCIPLSCTPTRHDDTLNYPQQLNNTSLNYRESNIAILDQELTYELIRSLHLPIKIIMDEATTQEASHESYSIIDPLELDLATYRRIHQPIVLHNNDWERLALLHPSIIIGSATKIDNYNRVLSKIAPTFRINENASWQNNLCAIAQFFHRDFQAHLITQDYRIFMIRIRTLLSPLLTKMTFSYFRWRPHGQLESGYLDGPQQVLSDLCQDICTLIPAIPPQSTTQKIKVSYQDIQKAQIAVVKLNHKIQLPLTEMTQKIISIPAFRYNTVIFIDRHNVMLGPLSSRWLIHEIIQKIQLLISLSHK